MAYFQSSAELKEVLGGFFDRLFSDPVIGPKLKGAKLKIQFNYTDPDLSISADTSEEPVRLLFNDASFKPDVQMSMKADVAHRFWHGKVNLVMALARREMSAKGPIPKILKLLPAIKPAYALYPQYLEEKGYGRLVIK
ncbi:MAG TPA: SCP2 sterol-binding domain-containing protein [bacterium]|nr:SCP2 sterol-binding domain-containing protein [bacterium]